MSHHTQNLHAETEAAEWNLAIVDIVYINAFPIVTYQNILFEKDKGLSYSHGSPIRSTWPLKDVTSHTWKIQLFVIFI